MNHDQYWQKPKKAKVRDSNADSWWYANERGIQIHVDPKGGHVVITLRRSDLERYMAKSAE